MCTLINTKELVDPLQKQEVLVLSSEDELDSVLDQIDQFQVIVINFVKPTDGRGFTLARLLRQRFGFSGTLRAAGPVNADQTRALMRCGFNEFELADPTQAKTALRLLAADRPTYQSCANRLNSIPRHGASRRVQGINT